MRQLHKAGEKCFVDYFGPTVGIISPSTGEVRQAHIFVAVLRASNYTYAEATYSQSLPDWLHSHVRAFELFGGIPAVIVPDNLKSGVTKACRYDPDLNPSYQQLAEHYQVAVVPARPYKPQDKAKADGSYHKLLKQLAKIQLLLIDDWGLEPLQPAYGNDLMG